MLSDSKLVLADANGRPFEERLQKVLLGLLPRLRRSFPNLRDEAVIANILEQAGQKISEREDRDGTVAELHGYAWTALRNATISMQRRSEYIVQNAAIACASGRTMLTQLPALTSGPEAIEDAVLLSQALSHLSIQERQIAIWKKAGFSVEEIASYLKVSPGSVNQAYFRMCHRLRKLLGHRN